MSLFIKSILRSLGRKNVNQPGQPGVDRWQGHWLMSSSELQAASRQARDAAREAGAEARRAREKARRASEARRTPAQVPPPVTVDTARLVVPSKGTHYRERPTLECWQHV